MPSPRHERLGHSTLSGSYLTRLQSSRFRIGPASLLPHPEPYGPARAFDAPLRTEDLASAPEPATRRSALTAAGLAPAGLLQHRPHPRGRVRSGRTLRLLYPQATHAATTVDGHYHSGDVHPRGSVGLRRRVIPGHDRGTPGRLGQGPVIPSPDPRGTRVALSNDLSCRALPGDARDSAFAPREGLGEGLLFIRARTPTRPNVLEVTRQT